jgi:hypothetical protein
VTRRDNCTRENPCTACGHPIRGRKAHCQWFAERRGVWCANAATLNGTPGTPHKGGWKHWLAPAQPRAPRAAYVATRPAPAPDAPRPDFASLARAFTRAMTPGQLEHLAGKLQLRPDALQRYRVGWATAAELAATGTRCQHDGAWTFPMFNAAGQCTGIRLRVPGFKYAVAGSDGSGLFLPTGLAAARGGLLLAPEGPTSAGALCQLGYVAAGRPNNRAGVEHLRQLCRDLRPRTLVIVGDNDARENPTTGREEWPGLEGAESTAAALRGTVRDVRVMLPPSGIKDARAWLHARATHADVWREIAALTPNRLTFSPGRLTA